jgi:hypothetical protein
MQNLKEKTTDKNSLLPEKLKKVLDDKKEFYRKYKSGEITFNAGDVKRYI